MSKKFEIDKNLVSNHTSPFGGDRDWLYDGFSLDQWQTIYEERVRNRDTAGAAEAGVIVDYLAHKNGIR